MEKQEIISIITSTFNDFRAKGIVKTQGDFAKILNISERSLSAAKHGKDGYCTDSMAERVIALAKGYSGQINISSSPHTNVATGHGQIKIGSDAKYIDLSDQQMIPVIPQNLYKETDINIVEYVTDPDTDVPMQPAVQQFPTTTCFYQVTSDAMFPHFHQGDILALKIINKTAPIVNGEVYAVDTDALGILVRFAYDRGDYIEMRSTLERAGRFEPFLIEKKNIFSISRVVGLIRTNI